MALRATGFVFADAAERERYALSMPACLAAPDPALRDGVAYEGLSAVLREGSLAPATQRVLAERLRVLLERPDPAGFGPPFAALVLSELAAADARTRVLPPPQLQAIAKHAAGFLGGVRDYRAFDEREGWRHAVAHGADLAAALARHPGLTEPDLLALLRDAVAAQVAPAGHAYVHGEPERLMAAVVQLARRGVFAAADWRAWFVRLADPAPLADWGQAFASAAGLARRHNLRAFLFAVLVEARLNASADDDVLLPAAEAALRAMS